MARITLIQLLTFMLILSMLPSSSSASDPDAVWEFTDIEGKTHRPFEDESTRGIVLVFISTDCPIANSYQPLLQRLANAHSKNGIRFFLIHPHPDLTVEQARRHASEFKVKTPVVIDSQQTISRRVGATITPQAFVVVRGQEEPVYQGRIDNLYAGYGKKRTSATTHDLADALDAVAANQPVARPKTKPVGCYISYAASRK